MVSVDSADLEFIDPAALQPPSGGARRSPCSSWSGRPSSSRHESCRSACACCAPWSRSGQIRFAVRVATHAVPARQQAVGESANRFTRAFLSYSWTDQAKCLSAPKRCGWPGSRCSRTSFRSSPARNGARESTTRSTVATCFLLFWSQAAGKSVWVGREIDRALEVREHPRRASPKSFRSFWKDRRHPPPPAKLSHLHFNDPILYLIAAQPPGGGSTH